VVRAELSALAVLPGRRGCLRCVMDAPPPAGAAPTCASEGVFGPLLGVAAALQISLANAWLDGAAPTGASLLTLDAEHWRWRAMPLGALRPDCPACSGRYEYLDGTLDLLAGGACAEGRSELELPAGIDLAAAQISLTRAGFATAGNRHVLRAEQDSLRYTLFAGGRVMLEGSGDPARLNRFVLTYLGQ
jgi:adenylyltransferase/sulfurtransferase